MIVFPNCKINLGLHITRKREDGYHDLETVFFPVHRHKDVLECVKTEEIPSAGSVVLSCSGLPVSGNSDDNLCVKAWHLLKKDFPDLLPVQMHLHKEIPMGAGLGGGSADGAFALRLLNDVFRLNLTQQQLMTYALQLGSDCPFFILNKPCIATGRGEQLEEIELDLSAYTIVVADLKIHVSTATAFSGITPKKPAHSLKDIVRLPVAEWKNVLVNDFEKTVGKKYSEIIVFKEMMYNTGALYASMTGSGSAVYGIFDRQIPLPSKWGHWEGRNPFPDDNDR
jgi:4-diphosphocytidyl-2-C-methyl-D-erythritol kinase